MFVGTLSHSFALFVKDTHSAPLQQQRQENSRTAFFFSFLQRRIPRCTAEVKSRQGWTAASREQRPDSVESEDLRDGSGSCSPLKLYLVPAPYSEKAQTHNT